MKKTYQLFVGVIISLSVAGCAYLWATNLMQSLYDYRSPLSKTTLSPGETTGPAITSKVVIILIDALRADTANDSKLMPHLNSLRNNAAWGIMHSQVPSYSEPGWTTILTGAWPEISDGPAINLDYEKIYPFTQDNIFSAAHRQGLTTAISGYYWFEKLLPSDSVDNSFYTQGEEDQADQEVLVAALPWVKDDNINLILIHIDQVDFAGHHEGGPQGVYWGEAAKRSDAMVQKIIGELDLSQDIGVILSDHGQIDTGGHGGQESVVLTEPFFFVGKSVLPSNYPDIQMVDIAPTISMLLGLNIPAINQGHPLSDMFDLNSDKIAMVDAAISNQQNQLLNAYAKAINQKDNFIVRENIVATTQNAILLLRNTRLKSEIIPRVLVLFLLGICLYFVLLRLTWNIIFTYLTTGIIYLAIFNGRYSIIDKHPYSLSWIPSEFELIAYIAVTSIVSFLISWLILIFFKKAYLKSPHEIAINTIFATISTIIVVASPVYFSYAINGPLVSWALPDMRSMYLAFIALLQCIFIALFGCFLTITSVPIHLVLRKFSGVNLYED